MNVNKKNQECHSGDSKHKGHGWMMFLCVLLMVGIPILYLTTNLSSFDASILGTALIPLILCLVMHGVMIKFMMGGSKNEHSSSKDEQLNQRQLPLVKQKRNDQSRFGA